MFYTLVLLSHSKQHAYSILQQLFTYLASKKLYTIINLIENISYVLHILYNMVCCLNTWAISHLKMSENFSQTSCELTS